MGSRRDLRRLNRLMGHGVLLARQTTGVSIVGADRLEVAELGSGDGTLMLDVLRRLRPRPERVRATLVDRLDVVSAATLEEFRREGWEVVRVVQDIFDWLTTSPADRFEVIYANLFLHHFEGEALGVLLEGIASRANRFVACEPRRCRRALLAARLVGFAGCNEVTRHDAVASVRAGFRGHELTLSWPGNREWELREHRAGCFSHLFTAVRLED